MITYYHGLMIAMFVLTGIVFLYNITLYFLLRDDDRREEEENRILRRSRLIPLIPVETDNQPLLNESISDPVIIIGPNQSISNQSMQNQSIQNQSRSIQSIQNQPISINSPIMGQAIELVTIP